MTNQTEQGAALAENPSPELLRVHQAGTTLANIAYNLAQRPGEPLTSDVVASLDACRREWDAACAAFKAARVALAKSTPEGCTSDGAEPTALDDLEFRYIAACEERDHLRAELSKSQALVESMLKFQQIQAARDARRADLPTMATLPAGYALVPLEPTEEMLAAAHEGDRQYTLRTFGDVMTVMQGPYDHWCAMVAAATKAATPGDSHAT